MCLLDHRPCNLALSDRLSWCLFIFPRLSFFLFFPFTGEAVGASLHGYRNSKPRPSPPYHYLAPLLMSAKTLGVCNSILQGHRSLVVN